MAKKPPLSRKDLKLWQKVTQSITPLEGRSAELKALIETVDQRSAQRKAEEGPDPVHPVQQRRKANAAELQALKDAGFIGGSRSTPNDKPPPIGHRPQGKAAHCSRAQTH